MPLYYISLYLSACSITTKYKYTFNCGTFLLYNMLEIELVRYDASICSQTRFYLHTHIRAWWSRSCYAVLICAIYELRGTARSYSLCTSQVRSAWRIYLIAIARFTDEEIHFYFYKNSHSGRDCLCAHCYVLLTSE